MVVTTLGLDGLDDDPGNGAALLQLSLEDLLDLGQAPRVLGCVLPGEFGERVPISRRLRGLSLAIYR